MRLEWWNDTRMRGVPEFIFLVHFEKHHHSTSFCHSSVIWKHFRMPRNENNNGKISFYGHSTHFYFIPISFITQEWWWNDGMRVKWENFLDKGKTLKSETHLIPPSFRHSSWITYSSEIHSFHLTLIQSF